MLRLGIIAICATLIFVGCACPPIKQVAITTPECAVLKGTCRICAQKHWNNTSIKLEAGHAYCLIVSGNQSWRDGYIRACGPDGYCRRTLWLFEPLRRMSQANWFALIGSVEKNRNTQFVIGSGLAIYHPSKTGNLFCYANDVYGFYWNNSGAISLSIYELPKLAAACND